eukprot:CAMPEP_0119414252 /NCGR_PEP_ID=MMETSP1335-20130426/6712_1 /TAXON_ID=259385 /ORGANISM="Chrysoculter rhomboideus, Strain RCC1486" /LENGTH=130 /DNA_ID=CAMNT_0007439117 /DNA_START=174 /DNA_END=564 /DNA_ORIENTATION=-
MAVLGTDVSKEQNPRAQEQRSAVVAVAVQRVINVHTTAALFLVDSRHIGFDEAVEPDRDDNAEDEASHDVFPWLEVKLVRLTVPGPHLDVPSFLRVHAAEVAWVPFLKADVIHARPHVCATHAPSPEPPT